ncbi:hypothetical protein BU23DRAFT_539447 [Bimuria novae-zelandiae CBS 107.79]|uniref:Galactose oxidase n=1 Tax=Bimuria novae-zelandiae CBS 107.79 TaxID=1447943 RepID=A0A6A5UYL8_9PLEO|nr:hypothetical protein BU23DRAFT_539447 [Bimuria novae-zelandiae CBS 107.79]
MLNLIFWAISAARVGAQSPAKVAGPDPVKNFCMRWWSQSIVKNDVLYIDSGVERFNVSGDLYLGINNHILSINLTETWDWKIPGDEPGGLSIDVTRKNVTNPDNGTPVPNLIRGHLFHGPTNMSQIYNFGGATYMYNQSFEGYVQPETSTYPLWTYNPDAEQPWDQFNLGQPWQPNHGAAAEDIEKGLGFYLGGQVDMGTSTRTLGQPFKDNTQNLSMPIEGMLIINLVDSTSTNISTSSMNRSTPRIGGTLDYIDAVGDSGILVALGGQIHPDLTPGDVANRTQGELITFDTVDVFDLESYYADPSSNGTWYQQATSGDIPPPRIDYCTVTTAAPDNSSHHIYIYGGVDPIKNEFYDDVVILSLPSFTWTVGWPMGESPRLGHNCHRAGKRQMVTVGGNVSNLPCDWELKGVAFLDLTTFEWGSKFISNQLDYQVPQKVWGVTNGTGEGKATVGEPKQGWTEKGLGEVFRKSRYTVPSTWNLPPDPTTQSNPTGEKKKSNVGAIAGGVVGGVAGLALIAGLLFFLHRRRVKARSPTELHSDSATGSRDGDEKKNKLDAKDQYELQGINENNPAELPGPEAVELNAPREFVEADHDTAAWASELPGTNTAPGGVHGVPIVRTPGDDLPESPEYTPGLKRPASTGSGRRRRRSSTSSERARGAQQASEPPRTAPREQTKEQSEDYFGAARPTPPRDVESPRTDDDFRTPAEQVSPPEPGPPVTSTTPSKPPTPPSPPSPPALPGTAL